MRKYIRYIAALIGTITLLLAGSTAWAEDDLLHIYFVDVGQADAAIVTCDNMVLMIDGGNAADSSLIYSMLKKTLSIEHIDYMIASHPHEDHVGGLSGALNACSVDTLYTPLLDYDTKAFRSMIRYAQEQGTTISIPAPGDHFMIGGADVEILGPLRQYDDMNDMSIICRITFGNTTFLFGGDAEWDAEHDLVAAGYDLSADVLKVNHHGSNTSSSYVFLRAVMPSYAIISVGETNSYGHPSEDVLSRLWDVGAAIMRTDELGTIECVSDGLNVYFNPSPSG